MDDGRESGGLRGARPHPCPRAAERSAQMPPKGSGAAYRVSVEKKERARGVSFQVRLLAKDGPSQCGPLRGSRAAVAVDRERIERATDRPAKLRRLLAELAQVEGGALQTPQRKRECPARRRVKEDEKNNRSSGRRRWATGASRTAIS